MFVKKLSMTCCALVLVSTGCGTSLTDIIAALQPEQSAATSKSFVAKGVFELRPVGFLSSETCAVWVEESGVVYHLFQDPDLSNADFDAITQAGVQSRLLLLNRKDLAVGCLNGPVVQVQQVLEIITP